ncbi:MAG: glutamine amidotransferase [Candidatus Saccharibacteria bacterium]|nr:glutamine amidotransferase [Candidatus Saccharibacteria bacterium]
MSKQSIHIVHLYPKEMNIYGDTGNRIILQKRLEWRGIGTKVSFVGIGDAFPEDVDVIIAGGGQDAGQIAIQNDLAEKKDQLNKLAENGVVMLVVCGMYQLFGRHFITSEGEVINGIGFLPLETKASDTRLIGNTVYDTPWGHVVGYENHSGLTTLDDPSLAFGQVIKGDGNNGHDGLEGCVVNNVFGTYSHGPVLSKNPQFADELLKRAMKRKYDDDTLQHLPDTLENQAADIAAKRPR